MLAQHSFYNSSMEKRQILPSPAADSLLLQQREQPQGCCWAPWQRCLILTTPQPPLRISPSVRQAMAPRHRLHLLIMDVTKDGHTQNPHHI